jgi:hypothetical protein
VQDRRPPRLDGGERETVLALLQCQRESLLRKVLGADESAATTSPVASGTTLAFLVAHLCRAGSAWVEERFAGRSPRPLGLPGDRAPAIGEGVASSRAGWLWTDAIASSADLDAPCRGDGATPPVNLRRVLAHRWRRRLGTPGTPTSSASCSTARRAAGVASHVGFCRVAP